MTVVAVGKKPDFSSHNCSWQVVEHFLILTFEVPLHFCPDLFTDLIVFKGISALPSGNLTGITP